MLAWFGGRIPVEVRIRRVKDVPTLFLPLTQQGFVLCIKPTVRTIVMETGQDLHTGIRAPQGCDQFAVEIPLGAHLLGIPSRVLAVPQTESIVMYHSDARIPGAGAHDKVCPLIRIEFFCLELLDKVLVPKFGLSAIRGNVMVKDILPTRLLVIHQTPVPLCLKGRHRVDAPVAVETQLGIQQPFRNFVPVE